ncbi:SDR family oxidoreductase [bacterium]|nr:SDR family oxidoreductase [bacterium]
MKALITGASSGIGEELAKIMAADGHSLILVARREEKLEFLATKLTQKYSVPVKFFKADLTNIQDREKLIEFSKTEGVDTLINNAGFGIAGRFAQTNLEKNLEMIELNISALVHLTRALVPGMIAKGDGRILNVASIAAFVPGAYMSVYYATKAFVHSHTVALSEELAGTGVTISGLYPGPTVTEFNQVAGVQGLDAFRKNMFMDAATVADIGYRGMQRGQLLILPGYKNKLIAALTKVLPVKVQARLIKIANGKRVEAAALHQS